jgi:hypothetical protein
MVILTGALMHLPHMEVARELEAHKAELLYLNTQILSQLLSLEPLQNLLLVVIAILLAQLQAHWYGHKLNNNIIMLK